MPGGYLSLLPLLAVALAADAAEQVNPAPTLPLLREMAGTWSGKEWMWLGHHTNPIGLPDAIAYRRLIDGKLLEERMVARPQSAYPFTRISFFHHNGMSGRYEYFSRTERCFGTATVRLSPSRDHAASGLRFMVSRRPVANAPMQTAMQASMTRVILSPQ